MHIEPIAAGTRLADLVETVGTGTFALVSRAGAIRPTTTLKILERCAGVLSGLPVFTEAELALLRINQPELGYPHDLLLILAAFEGYFPGEGVEVFVRELQEERALTLIAAKASIFSEVIAFPRHEGETSKDQKIREVYFCLSRPQSSYQIFGRLRDPLIRYLRTSIAIDLKPWRQASTFLNVHLFAPPTPLVSLLSVYYRTALSRAFLRSLATGRPEPCFYLLEEIAPLLAAGASPAAVLERARHPEAYADVPVAWWAPLAEAAVWERLFAPEGEVS